MTSTWNEQKDTIALDFLSPPRKKIAMSSVSGGSKALWRGWSWLIHEISRELLQIFNTASDASRILIILAAEMYSFNQH